MFGIWRTLLAIEVVIYHLIDVPVIGEYAVFGFFVLSGFLMTAIMQQTYGYAPVGVLNYLQNRALRLYPNYWFAAIISFLTIFVLGPAAVSAYNPHMIMPPTPGAWLENFTMIFFGWFPKDHLARLVPPAWALTVEIFYYVLIGLGASRTRKSTIIWVSASVIYVVGAYAGGGGGPNLYSAVPAGSLPFAMGAFTYHYRDTIQNALSDMRFTNPWPFIVTRWISCALFTIANAATGFGWLISLGNYVNVAISVLIVCTLYHAKPGPALRRVDRDIGDFSYPIYLLHWQMGAVASAVLFGSLIRGPTLEGIAAAGLGLALTILLGLVCARLIDPTIETLRARVRQRALAT